MITCDGCYYLASDGVTCRREYFPELDKPRNPKKPSVAWYVRWFRAFIGLFRKEKP